ncbi:hypothetical protein HYPSUDRAFT_60708 [Hypholoma sublateritium FD-334 SS-4]|uniref:DUF4050 domain-containing protein n=1 Tax=Hypholoma sublateritium (strain FD-334 SS-4) TaxID=945553 RepID=A0A0D2PGB8_HYPSF|nr:hypothetical protein HYPSUDRAFT_60708 [Hypholoma sublateritium FD-334 SS-4]
MPEPGPDYYAARRRLWLTPPPNPSVSTSRLSADRSRIEKGLTERNYPSDVWRVISSGQRLKRSLPMRYLIRIVHAAWLRDTTWPVGVVVPDSDDGQAANQSGNAPNAT